MYAKILISKFLFFATFTFLAQVNETRYWYFGNGAGLDFMTNPPSVLTNSSMTLNLGYYSSAVMSASGGNLLFYSNGKTVWNQNHNVMANGTGLNGPYNVYQPCIVLKRPSSGADYYIFTVENQTQMNGLYFSHVDMNLSAGSGSVVAKNVAIYPSSCATKIAATKHCNGIDYWIVIHEHGTDVFRSYLFTAAGVSTVAITSSVGPVYNSGTNNVTGCLKISPNGKKLAGVTSALGFDIYDFDNSTGQVSNFLWLANINSVYDNGIEFSPDGTKLYGSIRSALPVSKILQWDLCASTSTAIVSSCYTVSTIGLYGALQLANNGKIYVSRDFSNTLGVVNSPNQAGSGCNYIDLGQSVAPRSLGHGLPYFPGYYFLQHPLQQPFTYSSNCTTTSFSSAANNTTSGCAFSGFTLTGTSWDFGDPSSGAANSSTLTNPIHIFSGPGTYSVSRVYYYSCGGGIDTLKQLVTILGPTLSVSTTSINCANLGSGTVAATGGVGPYTFTWLPSNQTGPIAAGLSPGNQTILALGQGMNCTFSSSVNFLPLVPLTGIVATTSSVTCPGAATGTGAVSGLMGGSGSQSYAWFNGTVTFSTAATSSLSAGIWSISVTDSLTGCQIKQSFIVTGPPSFSLNLASNSATACVGSNIVLTGTNSGGTAGYTYSWSSGPATDTFAVNESNAGKFTYTLNSSDANNCLSSNTISVDFVANPILSTSDVSICLLTLGTLTVSGATSYTWSSPSSVQASTTLSLTDSPTVTTQYTVIGSALGCTAATTASIILYTSPIPIINHNSPLCEGKNLQLSALGGSIYSWTGPGFNSGSQNSVINNVLPTNSGIYNLLVTSAEGCTAAASATVLVNPTPTLTATGTTLCTSQTLNLVASSVPGAGYLWTGPIGFQTSVQNPSINNPSIQRSGVYIVKATSAQGCTNVATATVNVVTPPSLTVALSSHSLCYQAFNGSPNTITLSSAGANTYTLYTPNLIGSSSAGPSSSISTIPPYSASLSVGTATLEGSNGICSAFTTVVFTVIPNPTLTLNSYTPVICAGKNFTYTSHGANSYTWGPTTPGLNTYTSPVVVASPSLTSIYSVVGTSMGCNSPTQTSTITVYPLPTITVTPLSPTICPNTKITLSASGTGTSYTWTPAMNINTTQGPEVIVGPAATQIYSVIASANNCTNVAKVTVTVMPLPAPLIAVSKTEICINETLTLNGSGGVSYDWHGPEFLFYQGQEVSFKVSSLQSAGAYTLTVTDILGCKNSTITNIIVHPLPTGSLFGYKEEGCVPLCSNYEFGTSGSNGSKVQSSWEINKQVFGEKFKHCFYEPGDYAITGKLLDLKTSCHNEIKFNVLAHPRPEADFQYLPLKPVENLDEVIFTNTSRGEEQTKFQWFFNDNKGFESQKKNTSYLYPNEGQYPVVMIVTNSWNCKDTMIKVIKVEPDFNIYVPNVFTPNADDRNDVFLPVTVGTKLYTLTIYDRWGQRIFYSKSPQEGWDGTFRGFECKTDVYAWEIILSTAHGESKEYSGHVSLIR